MKTLRGLFLLGTGIYEKTTMFNLDSAYNIGEVLLNCTNDLDKLNCGLALTLEQRLNIENKVTEIVREKLGLPLNYKFPRLVKAFLDKTCKTV